LSSTVFAAFPDAFPANYNAEKMRVIGNPVRKEIIESQSPQLHYEEKWFRDDKDKLSGEASNAVNILVVGGSLGAAALNETLPQALQLIEHDVSLGHDHTAMDNNWFDTINIRHQCGKNNLEQTIENYGVLNQQSGNGKINVSVMDFINDMAESYLWADLIICRSGALTVSEIAATGRASLLVPFPHAVDDHQTANAQYLSAQGAAYLVQQNDLSKEKLAEIIINLDKKILLDMACKARKLSISHAAEIVAEECIFLAGDKKYD